MWLRNCAGISVSNISAECPFAHMEPKDVLGCDLCCRDLLCSVVSCNLLMVLMVILRTFETEKVVC